MSASPQVRNTSGLTRHGRMVGDNHRATAAMRKTVVTLLRRNLREIQGWLNATAAKDPHQALRVVLDMMDFAIPRMARMEHTGDDGGPVELHISWAGMPMAKPSPLPGSAPSSKEEDRPVIVDAQTIDSTTLPT